MVQVYYEKRKRRQEEKAANSASASSGSKKERKGSINNGAPHLPGLALPPSHSPLPMAARRGRAFPPARRRPRSRHTPRRFCPRSERPHCAALATTEAAEAGAGLPAVTAVGEMGADAVIGAVCCVA